MITQSVPASTESMLLHRPRILVSDPIAEDGIAKLRQVGEVEVATGLSPAELKEKIANCDALVVRSETKVTAELLAAAPKLRVVGRAGVGVDNIDIAAATEHGVLVLNAPTGNTIAAAEHAIALMMALVRNIPKADQSIREGRWDRKHFMGAEMRGKTLGVIGLGKIGFEVARIASQGLQMHVLAYDPVVTQDRAEQAGAELCDMETLLRDSDVLTVHVPMTDRTRGMIGAADLRKMKKGARVINVARGGIVDEAALAEAVKSGHIAGAAIDVFSEEPVSADNPLRGIPEIITTPHLGANTTEAQVNVASDVAEQIAEYLSGSTPRYAVNLPSVLPEQLARITPYLQLGYKMGSLAAQLAPAQVKRITISCAGELADVDPAFITAEVLRGWFKHFTETRVSPVNAKLVAKTHGLDVDERTTTKTVEQDSALLLEIAGSAKLRIAGTQIDGQPRITRIDDFRVDMQPDGTYLIVKHQDRPGVIAAVSTLLARHDINIAGIELGRDRPRGNAVMLMQIDEPLSSDLADEIRETAKLDSMSQVTL